MINQLRYLTNKKQYAISVATILLVTLLLYLLLPIIGYKAVALLLLFVVSLLAMLFNIRAVLLAAVLSALTWDFFFIPPVFTFSVGSTDDKLILLMYFVVAMVNAVLTSKIKRMDEVRQEQQEKENTIKLYNTILNSLSHELRTPISTIIAAADNLQVDAKKLSEDNRNELVNQISGASLRLNQQVENLLNMSRLESGTLTLKANWCDMNELIHESVNHTKDIATQHTVKISVPDDLPMCYVDGGLIGQVINNLLQNAFTYVEKGGSIGINASVNDKGLRLQVEDDGNGFPENEKEKVFDKFYRLKSSNTGGTGLGLSIVKGYVEVHRGTITLSNKKGGGALFTIEIPCNTQRFDSLTHE